MPLSVEVLSGERRGLRREFDGPRVTAGRHPDCDLRLDPEGDRAASARHAAFLREEGRWVVRDLGSRNGTFVNGSPVSGARRLEDGDRVRLGTGGPEVRVRTGPAAAAASSPSARTWVVAGLLLALTAGGGLYLWSAGVGSGGAGADGGAAAGTDRGAATDSGPVASRRALDSLRGRVARLEDSLRAARRREANRRPAARPSSPDPDGDEAGAPGVGDTVPGRAPAAGIDLAAIEERHWRALARVYVEGPGGEVATATAFGVRADGLLVTARHAVLDADGAPAPKIGVQFARSTQVWPAELVATTDSADLALIRARNVVGEVPVIGALSARPDTLLASNRPVAVLGYSGVRAGGGGEEPSSEDRLPRPRATAGRLIGRGPDGRLEVRGVGGQGGSGSPIVDASGQVIGVLAGGAGPEGSPHRLVAVPSTTVRGFLAAVLGGPER